MKIAIAGKGGVGKTTLAGFLARHLADDGHRVLAIDGDPDANLASMLPLDAPSAPRPLAARRDIIDALTGRGVVPSGVILLNPDIGAVLPDVRATWGGGHGLLVLGWHKAGGEGCYCAENAVLRRVLSTIVPRSGDTVVVDSEAGLEHMSRGTAASVDAVIAVVQPGSRSVDTAFAIRALAKDLGIARVYPVIVGSRGTGDDEAVRQRLGDWPVAATLPHDDAIRGADLAGRPPDIPDSFRPGLQRIATILATAGRGDADER